MNREIALVGPFSQNQRGVIQNGLNQAGLLVNASIHDDVTTVPPESLVAVRGGVRIPATRDDLKLVVSGGRGTANIDPLEGRRIYDCRGENAPETASHALALAIDLYNRKNHEKALSSSDIRVGVIGAGHVGANIALLAHKLGFQVKLTQRHGKGIPTDIDRILTEDQDAVLSESDLIIIAASGKSIIGSNDRNSIGTIGLNGKVLVNIARADAISAEEFNHLRLGPSISTDVWYEEPRIGGEIPVSVRNLLLGSDGLPSVEGTMHQAAQQESSNLAVAIRLANIMENLFKDQNVDEPTSAYSIIQSILSETAATGVQIASLCESSDIRRVQVLRKSLLGMVTDLVGRPVLWKNPEIILPKQGVLHDFVKMIRNGQKDRGTSIR